MDFDQSRTALSQSITGWKWGQADFSTRDKASLDIFWLRDASLEESENLPDPDVLAEDEQRPTWRSITCIIRAVDREMSLKAPA